MDFALGKLIGRESKDIDSIFNLEQFSLLAAESYDDQVGNVGAKETLLAIDYQSASHNALKRSLNSLLVEKVDINSLVILFKILCGTRRDLMSVLLQQVPVLNHELFYWNQRLKSSFSVFQYGVEMFPTRFGNYVWMNLTSGWQQFKFDWNFKLPIHRMATEIKRKRDALAELGQTFAKCLGMLAQSSYFQDSNDLKSLFMNNKNQSKKNHEVVIGMRRLVLEDLKILDNVLGILSNDDEYSPHILDNFESMELNPFVQGIGRHLKKILGARANIIASTSSSLKIYSRPSFLERNWASLSLIAAATLGYRTQIQNGIKSLAINTLDTLESFFTTWIVEPLIEMLKTIRRKEVKLAMVGVDTLNSDLQSLERMVQEYAQDHGVAISADLIAKQVSAGDLSLIMRDYENELKNPVKSILAGSMIRSLLIQMQKLKVDGAMAMTALDKLLRSNELNFAFLAVIPALAVTYYVSSSIINFFNRRRGYGQSLSMQQIRSNLRQIEILLCENNIDSLITGKLIFYLIQVYQDGSFAFEDVEREMFLDDLSDLQHFVIQEKAQGLRGIQIVNRIWRIYPSIYSH